MKEFSSQTGGRFTYVDDLLNLQELALAFSSIFSDCDNFIISGCEVENDTITPGVVFLNGKLRIFNGASGVTVWPQYIYELNTTENIPYQSGGEKVGRNIWGCVSGSTVPTSLTPLTNKIPQSIQISTEGGVTIKDIWFGKYALLLNPSSNMQIVNSNVTVNSLTSQSTVNAKERITVTKPAGAASLGFENSDMVLESSFENGAIKYRFLVSDSKKGFELYKNDVLIASFADSKITFTQPVSCQNLFVGSIAIQTGHIFNNSTDSDSGDISINFLGLNGKSEYYRNTHIGNGKNSVVLSVIGKTKTVNVRGELAVYGENTDNLTLHSQKGKTDMSLTNLLSWFDNTNEKMAYVGYATIGTQIFGIKNNVAAIKIEGVDYVDIAPYIKENGTLLSDKYVTQTSFTDALNKKIDSASTYSKIQADDRFAKLANGLGQFISSTKTKEVLCQEIGALTKNDLSSYPLKSNCLSDMATTDELKKKIRENIGAASAGDYQSKLKDTGWVHLTQNLYARQIGDIVCIQGTMTVPHEGTVFTIPNNIDAPRHAVGFDGPTPSYTGHWGCKIDAGSKICYVYRCNYHNISVPISITYMT